MRTDDAAASDRRQALATTIRDAAALAMRLRELLAQEKSALAARDVETVTSSGLAKQDLAAGLEQLERRRLALCQQLGANDSPDRRQMRRLLADDAAANVWDRYCDLLRECHEANAVNGRLVHLRRRHVQRALRVLSGQPDGEAAVYGPSGKGAPAESSRVLGSA